VTVDRVVVVLDDARSKAPFEVGVLVCERRRVLFDVLVGNRDEHLRNHDFLRGSHGWRLAPAFDVNPNPDMDEHALALDESSSIPSVAAVRTTREFYRLSSAAASRIEKQVRSALEDWRSIARSIGISQSEIHRLEAVIDLEAA
jgi:serine/threonine-protein kinase HipA